MSLQQKYFFVPARDPEKIEENINKLLRGVSVVDVQREFVPNGNQSYWSVFVEYVIDGNEPVKTGTYAGKLVDYKERLSDPDFRRRNSATKFHKRTRNDLQAFSWFFVSFRGLQSLLVKRPPENWPLRQFVPGIRESRQRQTSRTRRNPIPKRISKKARKMVGWTPCKIVGPSISREVELATTPGDRPTHPTIPNRPVRIAANGNKSRQKRISGLVLNSAAWIPGLRYMFYLRNSRKRRNPAVLSTPGVHTAPPGMTSAGTIVLESGRRYNQAPAPLS